MPVVRQQFTTTDPDVAAEILEAAFDGGKVRLTDADDFRFGQDLVQGAGIALVTMEFASQLHALSEEADGLRITWNDRGTMGYSAGSRQLDIGAGLLWSGRRPIEADVDNALARSLILDRNEVETRARALLGRPDFVVPHYASLVSEEHVDLLRRHAETIDTLLLSEVAADNPLIARSLADLTIALILTAAGLDDAAEHETSGPATVRRALAFIDENLGRPISVADIAAAAGLSARGLQDAFRRTTGETPMGRVRRGRLARAHDDLVREGPSTETVAAIARRWGFPHLGRFAIVYRAQFGELPSETLRR